MRYSGLNLAILALGLAYASQPELGYAQEAQPRPLPAAAQTDLPAPSPVEKPAPAPSSGSQPFVWGPPAKASDDKPEPTPTAVEESVPKRTPEQPKRLKEAARGIASSETTVIEPPPATHAQGITPVVPIPDDNLGLNPSASNEVHTTEKPPIPAAAPAAANAQTSSTPPNSAEKSPDSQLGGILPTGGGRTIAASGNLAPSPNDMSSSPPSGAAARNVDAGSIAGVPSVAASQGLPAPARSTGGNSPGTPEQQGNPPLVAAPPAEPRGSAQAPGVYLEIIGPPTLNVGVPLVYEIVVRNTGIVPVENVRVEAQAPRNATMTRADPQPEIQSGRLSWNLGGMEPGQEKRLKVEVRPTTREDLLSYATVTYSASANLRTRLTQPVLTLTKTGPESVLRGDPAVFQIDLTNSGSGPATGVVLHDRMPPGLQHESGTNIDADIGELAPGQTKHVTLTTHAVQIGRQVNVASATADNAAPVSAQAAVLVTEPKLALRKTGPQTRFIDREAEFDIEIDNPGTAPATNVRVVDTLPPGLDFLEASEGGVHDPNSHTVTWVLGSLNAASHRGLRVKAAGKTPGDYVNQCVAQADRGLNAQAQATLHIDGVPALMLEVVDLDDPIEVGAETTYEIRVLNQGSVASAGLRIIANVPAGMKAVSASGPAPYRIQGQQVVFDPVDKLACKADALYRVKVLCQEAGDWRFRVQMSCDQSRLPVFEEESTRVYKD